MYEEIVFHSHTRGDVNFEDMVREIVYFIKKEPERRYKVIIGTDSEAGYFTSLVTAVTIVRVGNGAIYFWTRRKKQKFSSRYDRNRIWAEAISSITLGQAIRSRLKEVLADEFFWDANDIHVDIGNKGRTRELVEGISGMIKGYDFVPVIKPYSFVASIVADRHT